jgi:ferric-dicitrate binding protein FerR (iron transport regulator)
MPNIKNSGELINKYILNTCTREEMDRLLKIIGDEKDEDNITQILKDHWEELGESTDTKKLDVEKKFSILMEEIKKEIPVSFIDKKRGNWPRFFAAAAIIICIISTGAYFLFKSVSLRQIANADKLSKANNKNNDIHPGKNTATLTLSDGTTVILDETQNGTVSTQGNTKILKLDNGILSYNASNKGKVVEVLYNTISTPKGGQYQLLLSDGSKVWLNAASSLKFPAAFTGKERKVELLGEAYFEVAKNENMPFKVKADGMEVEVLGTHFNINSYDDESIVRTTLLEGSVKINGVKSKSFLKPGQQAKLDRDGDIRVINDADIDEAVAWKEGRFQFNRADIHEVMRQIARWYNVNIEYRGIVSSHFGGTISRDVNLSQVLKMLQLTGEVKFYVEDRKVVVIPNVL